MTLRLTVVALALSLALSYGAVLPANEDFLFDTLQSFLAEPDTFASALGMSRVKRSAWDREFNLASIGAGVKIKYDDPNNKLKGGKAEITIDNLRQYVRSAKSDKVRLEVEFNGGDSNRDGLFDLKVKYELYHRAIEKGVATLSRTKEGDLWVTNIKVENTDMIERNGERNVEPIFHSMEGSMKSDRQTFAKGQFECSEGHQWTLDVNRQPGKQINAVLEGNGKKYSLEGRLDQADKKVEVDVDADGRKYAVSADFDVEDGEGKMELEINLASGAAYKIEASGRRDLSDAKLKITFNDAEFASLKMKGKVDKSAGNAKFEVRYSVVGLGKGMFRFARKKLADGGEVKAMFKPENGPKYEFEGNRKVVNKDVNLHATISKEGENMLEYNIDMKPTTTAESYEMNVNSQFDVNPNSVTYGLFCTYGCFQKRSLKARMFYDLNKPYKMDIDVSLSKDDEEVLMVDINTINNPRVFKINAPRILPKILPTGRESIEFEADLEVGKHLLVTSNTNAISSFSVENLGNGMRKISLNGQELVQGDFNMGEKSISQTTKLPDGRQLTTTISWAVDDVYDKNTVTVKLDGTERQFDGTFDWDVTNPADMFFKANGKGQNKRFGNYEISRDIKGSSVNGVIKCSITGTANIDNFPLPSPIDTDMNAMLDTNTGAFAVELNKTFGGRKVGVSLKDGKLSINM